MQVSSSRWFSWRGEEGGETGASTEPEELSTESELSLLITRGTLKQNQGKPKPTKPDSTNTNQKPRPMDNKKQKRKYEIPVNAEVEIKEGSWLREPHQGNQRKTKSRRLRRIAKQ
ncbi:MAG: hypothetical protein Q8877_03455, partial [Sweet potato little leaf phytoplasma]|nr:hypothetical protein [Sweet potato little leaf phytoplasma]